MKVKVGKKIEEGDILEFYEMQEKKPEKRVEKKVDKVVVEAKEEDVLDSSKVQEEGID
jgi:hypothetical protein